MAATTDIPRLVIAGASSGSGKTTLTVALIRALRARGLVVAPFKCGPDYLDPTYHARAAGRPSHNLDGWMMGREAALATFARCARGADVAVIEGVMGLYDGASPRGEEGSTAEMAKWLAAPVVAVVDASGMARTLAALAQGLSDFDPGLALAGLLCNQVGSRGHLQLLGEALEAALPRPSLDIEPEVAGHPRPLRLFGGLPRRANLSFPERHLGLHTADDAALPETRLESWGAAAAEWMDLDAILALARSAPPLATKEEAPGHRIAERCRIGVAFDEAFHFYYEDNLARLEALGARLVRFSPLRDASLPEVDGLLFGGGYPEEHASALSGNRGLRAAISAFAAEGAPIYAECGGLMALCQAIRTTDGELHPMLKLLPGIAEMKDRLVALSYVEVQTRMPTFFGPAGLRLRGHQFRYSELTEVPVDLARAYELQRRRGDEPTLEGYSRGSVLGSYVHVHWASCPQAAAGFVDACARRAR